ncbi:MAG TPA: radical SAM protein [Chlorobaculum parvum]|uniref:Radical SAM protein n=1 Tax=Chlorobaculum parvum TaxID=274539 RepID=A0A7C5DGL6_9CHLB|nr:radical SAM protein [Chlorobaculum parvum]
MAYYKNICFVEAPQAIVTPFPRYISDCIGVCYLAAAVEDIVESMAMPENYYNDGIFESFEKLLKLRPFDLVAISSMTGGFNNAEKLARIAKKHGMTVVVGGFHPTALPEQVLNLGCVDLVVMGEGEATFRELVEKGPSYEVKGLCWKENGEFIHTGMRELIKDVDSIRFPLRSLRPKRFGEKSSDYTIDTIYTSRGCPWACSFCANDKMHKQWRGRSAENVVEEIALLHDPKKKKLLKIWDANFLTNIKRVEKICDLMIERGFTNFRIVTETRAKDVIRAERILPKLRKIGLSKVGLGIESPNPKTLALMNKQNTLDEVSSAIGLLKKYGVGSEGYFILGHLSETVDDTMVYPEFARGLGLKQTLFMSMTPYPGTQIFNEYARENNITSRDWDLYNNFVPVIRTEHMEPRDIMRMMVYCNVAFCDYRSLLKRNNSRGVLLAFLKDLFQLVFLMKVNKFLDRKEVAQIIFEAFDLWLGTDPKPEYAKTPPQERLKKPTGVCLLHDALGQRFDFLIRHENGKRVMTVRKVTSSEPTTFPVISLEKVVDVAWRLTMGDLMRLLYRNELMRNNSHLVARQILALLADRDIRQLAIRFYKLYRSCFR